VLSLAKFNSFRNVITEKDTHTAVSLKEQLRKNLKTYKSIFKSRGWRTLTDAYYLIYLTFIDVSPDLKPLQRVLNNNAKLVEELSAIRKNGIIQRALDSCVSKINFYELVQRLEEMKYLNKREGHNIRINMPETLKSKSP